MQNHICNLISQGRNTVTMSLQPIVVLGFGCFLGLLEVIPNKAGVSLGWIYHAMGVFIGSAVLPIAFKLLWPKANAIGAIRGSTIGRVNLDTTGRNALMLAGNLVSILTGGAIHAVCSFCGLKNYDWDPTKQITMVEKEKSELLAEEFKEEKLIRAIAWIVKWGVGFTVVIVLLWPLLSLPTVSRSTVKHGCRDYNITWWSPRKRIKDNHLLSNKLVQGVQDVATVSRTKPHFTAAQNTSVVTIKANYRDDFIRFQLPVLLGIVEFQQQVAKRLNLKGETYHVKYQEEDNDWILIACDEDLQSYICNSISQGRKTVTILLQSITNCPP
ncbi:unnamed protein product [Camellia sinensis]